MLRNTKVERYDDFSGLMAGLSSDAYACEFVEALVKQEWDFKELTKEYYELDKRKNVKYLYHMKGHDIEKIAKNLEISEAIVISLLND